MATACVVVLVAVSLSALNTAMTGAGRVLPGSVSSGRDQQQLAELFKGLLSAGLSDGALLTPSRVDGSGDASHDTTAALCSAAIMANLATPSMLVSHDEQNPVVSVDEDYDHRAYSPAEGVFWDPAFVADLERGSNASFAHLGMCGERFDRHWKTVSLDARFPLMGSRGPLEGALDRPSYTLGRDGRWAGHLLFGDGHVEWTKSMAAPGRSVGAADGSGSAPDGLFSMEEGPDGGDAILSFTRRVEGGTRRELQFD